MKFDYDLYYVQGLSVCLNLHNGLDYPLIYLLCFCSTLKSTHEMKAYLNSYVSDNTTQ